MDTRFFANHVDLAAHARVDDPDRRYRVLVADLVGLQLDSRAQPDNADFVAHIKSRGALFHSATTEAELRALLDTPNADLPAGIHFYYAPQLSAAADIAAVAHEFDAVIAAATQIPHEATFPGGGVRIGAGTANMASQSFTGGTAPLMNTPSFNSRATAQAVFKALLHFCPELPLLELHQRVLRREFDTADDLRDFPVAKLEGRRLAVLGFGNIGREVALLGRAFCMDVVVFARSNMRRWIEAEGFAFAESIAQAAKGADVLSPHLGLGTLDDNGEFANAGVINGDVLGAMARGGVLINFDRAELVDVPALADALTTGQVGHMAVDADVFIDRSSGHARATGPLADYLSALETHADKTLLLPHIAADTDHPSRVAGARQAADQIIAAIRYGVLVNAVGEVPEGYVNLGPVRLPGIGAIAPAVIESFCDDRAAIDRLRGAVATLDSWLAQLAESPSDLQATREQDNTAHSETQAAVEAMNQITAELNRLGLQGPGRDL